MQIALFGGDFEIEAGAVAIPLQRYLNRGIFRDHNDPGQKTGLVFSSVPFD